MEKNTYLQIKMKLKNKRRNRKGISIMIGYILLITTAIIISTIVFQWAKTYIQTDPIECPDGVSISIKKSIYNCENKELNLTLKNNGRFNIGGYLIHATTSPSQELASESLSEYTELGEGKGAVIFVPLGNIMKPNNEIKSVFDLNNLNFSQIYSVEIIPILHQDGKRVNCADARIKEKLSCFVAGPVACNDGIDNDGDSLIDSNDPGCSSLNDTSELDLTVACDDGIDNDGDTFTDSNDPGCSSPTDTSELNLAIECDDGIDNDGDSLIDSNDPECSSPTDTSESVPPLLTLSIRVSTENDDAEERISDGKMNLKSTELELIREAQDQEVGMRFQNINISPGSTIINATIQFTVDEEDSEATNLIIYGQNIDDAQTFSSTSFDITSRAKTTASVTWNNIPTWNTVGEAGPNQKTPNLASIIQEIINRQGWSINNSIVIIVTGSGKRVAESYNGDSGSAPLLEITYT